MKKIIVLFFLGSLITLSVFAQTGSLTSYTSSNLTPELNAIVENVKTECSLTPDQYTKFRNDYVGFLNENAKPNANTQGLFFLLGIKLRGYLKEAQFTKITKMVQEGKLTPKKTSMPATATATKTVPQSISGSTPLSAAITNQSNVTAIFEQLESFMKITPEKAAQIIPILKDYDQQLTKIKTENAGNAGKINQLRDALNGQAVPKLKMHMTDQQIATLVVALAMQENILTGKNLSAEQKIFLDKIRNQYGLNDVQTMSVILVLVQGKIRGDAIGLIAKTNPQAAGQEFIKLMQDLDGQLKSSLTNDQYMKVKSDIEKLLKGQKL